MERYKVNLDQTRHEAEEDTQSLETEIREKMSEIVTLEHDNKELQGKIEDQQVLNNKIEDQQVLMIR